MPKKPGLDGEEFRQAVILRKYSEAVDKDNEAARRIGITGIPCFIANGQGKMDVQTYEELLELLNEGS